MRLFATLIIIILCGLPALFAGWPGHAPDAFDARYGGVPGSILAMSGLLLAFVVIAGICGVIARNSSGAPDREAGQ